MKIVLALLVLAYAYHGDAAYTCEILKGQKLEPVNGKGLKLDVPCKFNAIRQTCGKWSVRLSPGNIYVDPRYFLNTVWVGVEKDGKEWEGRTYTKSAIKYINYIDAEDVPDKPFAKKGGNLDTDEVFKFSNTDDDVTATSVDGAFSITFGPYDVEGIKHRNVALKFTCNEDDEPSTFPDTICGGTDAKELENEYARIGFTEKLSGKTKHLPYYYKIFTDATTDQTPSPRCGEVVDVMLNNCTAEKRVEAIERCHTILSSKKHRSCAARFSCEIIDVFYNCVATVCSNFEKSVYCDALGEAIDMCREFPNLSDNVSSCYKGLLAIDPDSVEYKAKNKDN